MEMKAAPDRAGITNQDDARLFAANCDALRHELSWTHYRLLLRLDSAAAREWYMHEAATENWNTRALDRHNGPLYCDRLLASRDRQLLREEAQEKLVEIPATTREFIPDPVVLEFLGLPGTGRLLESKLEHALIDNLLAFLHGVGQGFRLRGPPAAHQHGDQGFLCRLRLLQLSAEVLCPV